MRTARQSAIRLLQLMMVASLVLPAILFAYASWINYRYTADVVDDRIDRSVDILHEHALKVFQTVERAIAEVDEIIRDMSDAEIRAEQQSLHGRLRRIVEVMPQLRAMIVIGADGRPLVTSTAPLAPTDINLKDRDYFKPLAAGYNGTYVGEVRDPRTTGIDSFFFNLSRRRETAKGAFNGVIAAAVLPSYFEQFYSLIGRNPGTLYALVREDGMFLARYPVREGRTRRLDDNSGLRRGIKSGRERGIFTVARSQIDSGERRIGYRKLAGFPVYVLAGTDFSAIRAEWLSTMGSHLIFGLPATLVVFSVLGMALRRTRHLHAEAERREAAEAALRQSQRLEAIGQLTGGVAHDFNNLLMIVSGSVQQLRRDLTDEKHTRLLDMISNATDRGESLTRQLLAFSRRQTLQPTAIDLGQRLPELKDMLSRSLRGDIEIRLVAPERGCVVKVDPSELELALLNLAVNARDAMPSGGTLTITAKPVVLRGKAAEEGLRGEFVALRVADTGDGVAPDVLPRVFEPFFTTKEVGKGTGLGLSQVYGFARQSGGTAIITSTVGRGTAITLFLPRTWEMPAPAPAQAEVTDATRRTGKVLLVEDNSEVAEVGRAYFEQLGYQVKQAASAQAALDLLEREQDFDLMFSDILMPGGINGLDLAQAVRARFARMPILLTTGFSSSAQDAVRQGFEVLQKPYDVAALEAGVRAARKWAADRQPAAQVK